MARKRVSKKKRAKNERISSKIEVLEREGKTPEQAAGEAYGMEREHRLRKGGKYVRVHKRNRRRGSRE